MYDAVYGWLGRRAAALSASLTFVDDRIEPFVDWHHVRSARIADVSCVLLHYPFNRGFYDKVEEAARTRRYEFQATHEYRAYWAVLADEPELSSRRPTAQRFVDVEQLAALGFVQVSDRFRQWAADHGLRAM